MWRTPCEVGGASEKSMVKDSGEVENGKPSINDAKKSLNRILY